MRIPWLGLAAIGVIAFASAGCGDDEPASLPPGIWLAITSPGPLERPVGHAAPLRVLNAVTGQERSFGPAASYFMVAWAPRGDRLAAFGIEDRTEEEPALFIRIWDAGGDVVATAKFESGDLRDLPADIAWSPDGTRLLVRTNGGFFLLDSKGKRVGAVYGTPLSGSGGRFGRRDIYWAPDSRHVADELNGLLLVTDRDGKAAAEYDLRARTLALIRAPSTLAGQAPPGCASSSRVRQGEVCARLEFFGELEPRRIAWDAGAQVDLERIYESLNPQRRERLNQLVPGRMADRTTRTAAGQRRWRWRSGTASP